MVLSELLRSGLDNGADNDVQQRMESEHTHVISAWMGNKWHLLQPGGAGEGRAGGWAVVVAMAVVTVTDVESHGHRGGGS